MDSMAKGEVPRRYNRQMIDIQQIAVSNAIKAIRISTASSNCKKKINVCINMETCLSSTQNCFNDK